MGAAALFCLALSAGGPAFAQEPPGRAVFDAAGCRSCHRIGESGGNAGPDLTLVGFRRQRAWLELWLADPRAWKKDTLMPRPGLSAPARAALADYLSSLRGQEYGSDGPPWRREADSLSAGRAVYGRAGCVACHGPLGAGGHPNNNVPGGRIPSLAAVAATYTPAELQARIRRGSHPVPEDARGPKPLVDMPAWGEVLRDGEIEAVSAYVLSLAAKDGGDW